MKSVKIDNEVYAYLQKKAAAFEEGLNDVLRRILISIQFIRHGRVILLARQKNE